MSNNIVKIRLQYKDRVTSVELDASCFAEFARTPLRALWEAMDDPPIRLNPPQECKVELCDVEQNKSSEPIGVHLNVCPRQLNSKDNCMSFDNGECLFYHAALNDNTKRLCAYRPESKTNS